MESSHRKATLKIRMKSQYHTDKKQMHPARFDMPLSSRQGAYQTSFRCIFFSACSSGLFCLFILLLYPTGLTESILYLDIFTKKRYNIRL